MQGTAAAAAAEKTMLKVLLLLHRMALSHTICCRCYSSRHILQQ
jgi:hypothetical protein